MKALEVPLTEEDVVLDNLESKIPQVKINRNSRLNSRPISPKIIKRPRNGFHLLTESDQSDWWKLGTFLKTSSSLTRTNTQELAPMLESESDAEFDYETELTRSETLYTKSDTFLTETMSGKSVRDSIQLIVTISE